eukprot:CAMPEP_0116118034 /NCGR_PEP_ID=MMETSP0329-20121206/1889_1 /TAXON_ID=697910 /ORGANISM="Pseudo-nitzschia arenysensis, Strain B593" /LENGTH=793 /DNA_ID=CAMNT_0003611635 /DNA_START=151 /DNA_END=2532 /DNA_ORIENTATION=+
MNNPSHNGENRRRQQPPAPPGHPSIPPQYQHHFQHRPQDPQLALLLANAAAARGQPPSGGHPVHLGAGNNHNGGGFANPGHFGNISERHGVPGAMSQSAAAQLFEEQILQRASALRAEALMQQQQQQSNQFNQQQSQQHQQQLQIQAALKAIQQQQQLSSTSEKTSPHLKPIDPHQQLLHQQQEATLLARAAALRELGLAGSPGSASPTSALLGAAGGTSGLDRLREQLDINALMRHRQQQQQSQQRPPYGLEQEIERVRQAQQLAAIGSPKPSASAVPANAAEGASGILGSLSAAPATARETNTASDVATAVQKAIASSSEGSERAVASIPKSPKPKVEPSQNDKDGSGASNRASQSKSQPSSGVSSTLPKMGRTTPPLKPNPRHTLLTPEESKQTKETAGAGAAAAAAVRCKTKDELRKNPGTVIVPCRARGMPMDHNFISAYFVISEDAKHGENLVCSYYACRNGGIKFRYCAYCMAPVAKRNFSRRHDHGMSKKKGANSIRDEDEDDEDDDTLGESENTASDKDLMNNAVNSLDSVVKRPTEPSAPEIGSKRPRLEADTISTEDKGSEMAEGISSKRISMWNNLLNKRPRGKDPKGLSSWLNEVIAVSDPAFPLDEMGEDMDRPLGKLLLNELPKLAKPAATPSEDEAVDTMNSSPTHSNSSPEIADDSAKDSADDGKTTNATDIVVGEENSPSAPVVIEKEKDSASETGKGTTTENEKVDEEASSSKVDASSSNGTKISPKKSSVAGVEETEKKKRKKEDDGFAGSFADWRDRKKGKSLKKGSTSLRK